jgi:nucleotide-binding universal stress UspA family protein
MNDTTEMAATEQAETEQPAPGGGFTRVLAVLDHSSDGRYAGAFAAVVADQFGGTVTTVHVSETKTRHRRAAMSAAARPIDNVQSSMTCLIGGPTMGARNRELSRRIADAARASGADVIVLGMDRHRLARHRPAAQSLRALVAEATDVAVLQAPPTVAHQSDGTDSLGRATLDPLSVEATGTLHKGRYAGV